ncbi:cell division control protein [Marssonina coronariae]|uniref:Cell division control protein n=1 Tax=Diplocarpon coronariae TaxID=2795749 RepID=A0A218Z405_9HELO|nr:cell division control protein [Marssonina coronariae]
MAGDADVEIKQEHKKKVNLNDASGAEHKGNDDTATAILKKKKKPNSLMQGHRCY